MENPAVIAESKNNPSFECKIIKYQPPKPSENQNRKTQIVLGTHKTIMKTEASSHYKAPEILSTAAISNSAKPEKPSNFSLGNHQAEYKTTSSSAYPTYQHSGIQQFVSNPVNNIFFGGSKPQMTSIGHSEFLPKKVEKLSPAEMGKIKDNHRSAHFVVGSYPSGYTTTSKEYSGNYTEPAKFSPDRTPHVVFGNYRALLTTEKQDNFVKQEMTRNNSHKSGEDHRRSHFYIGNQPLVVNSTALDAFQGKQLQDIIKPPEKDYSTSVNLGSQAAKWQSSYHVNYANRSFTPHENGRPNTRSNVVFGLWKEGENKTTAQDSFVEHDRKIEKSAERGSKGNNVNLGGYKNKFETSSKCYGASSGRPARIEKEMLDNITACHFQYGSHKNEYLSKFQEDYKNPGYVPEKVDLRNNQNKKSHLVLK